jgi:hypothetical protein
MSSCFQAQSSKDSQILGGGFNMRPNAYTTAIARPCQDPENLLVISFTFKPLPPVPAIGISRGATVIQIPENRVKSERKGTGVKDREKFKKMRYACTGYNCANSGPTTPR